MKPQAWMANLQRIVGEDVRLTEKNLILEQDGAYHVFDRYLITPGSDMVRVERPLRDPRFFSSLRVALSWCIADKFTQDTLARDITQLDQQRRRLHADIDLQQALCRRYKQSQTRDLVRCKMETKRMLLDQVNERLTKCVNLAKYWQTKGFNDEIARTRRPAPHRTNRPRTRKSFRTEH